MGFNFFFFFFFMYHQFENMTYNLKKQTNKKNKRKTPAACQAIH